MNMHLRTITYFQACANKLYEVLTDYIEIKYQKIYGYIENIVKTCLKSFSGDCSQLVREAALHPLVQILCLFEPSQIKDMINPARLIGIMQDEIKLRRPGATLKATIWELVGMIHKLYPEESQEYRLETQDVMMNSLLEQFDSEKFEIKHICGILRGFSYCLHDCVLEPEELQKLFKIARGLIKPNKAINSVRVCVEAITLLSTHSDLFSAELLKESKSIISNSLEIGATQPNQDIREASSELLAQVATQVANCENENEENKKIAHEVIELLTQVWNDESEHSVKIEPTVKAVGILSKGIKELMGEDTLKIYLEKLMFVEMNTYRIVEEFGDLSDPEREVKKFKVILKKQKQLISFLFSYANFVKNMDTPPGERECQHFYDLALTATRNFRKLYVKWRPKFLEALASLIMALHKHQAIFIHWIVRFVNQAVGDIITVHEGVTKAELEESLDDGVLLWQGLIEAAKVQSEPTCVLIYDTLMNSIIQSISSVTTDVYIDNYSGQKQNDDKVQSLESNHQISNTFLYRLSDFMLLLIPNCQSEWFLRWYPNYVQLVHRLITSVKSPKLYPLMIVPLITVETKDIMCKAHQSIYEILHRWIMKTGIPTLNDFRSGFLHIGGEERKKHLLLDYIEQILRLIKGDESSAILLNFNHSSEELKEAEKARTEIFNFLLSLLVTSKDIPVDKNEEETEEDKNMRKGRIIALKKLQAAKENRNLIKNEYEEIEVRILGLLGRLGGISHKIVKEDTDKLNKVVNEKVEFVDILTNKSSGLQFNVNLEGFGFQIQLNKILSKVIELSEHEADSDNKNVACDLMNSLKANIEDLLENKDILSPSVQGPPFKVLCIQFVRWFAQSIPFDSVDTRNMLAALQEIAFSDK